MASGFNMKTAIKCRGARRHEAMSLLSSLQVTPEDTSPAAATAVTSTAPSKQESESARRLDQSFQAVPCSSPGTEEENIDTDLGVSAASHDTLQMDHAGMGIMEENPRGQETEKEDSLPMAAQCNTRGSLLVTQVQSSMDRETSEGNDIDLKELLNLKSIILSDTSSSESVNSDSSNWSSDSDDVVDLSEKRGARTDFSSSTSDQMDFDVRRKPAENDAPLQKALQVRGFSAECAKDVQSLLFVSQQGLENFVRELRDRMRDSGVCVINQVVQPVYRQGVMHYEEGRDFDVEKILQQRRQPFGVFLCRDKVTKKRFIIKKIETPRHRLPGYEFWVQNMETYLPQIYALYKEKDVVWIFQEFIPYRLTDCQWSLSQTTEFGRCLLHAVRHMHEEGLAHCDLKLDNIMVRDPHRPDSLVLIDFDSAKHKDLPFQQGGQGHTVTYLPPWHRQIQSLEEFDPVLMTADLWAVACILIPFILSAFAKVVPSPGHTVWAGVIGQMRRSCPNCSDKSICDNSLRDFQAFLEKKGGTILKVHLAPLMTQCTDDLDIHWPTLYRLLEYLTDPSNIDDKSVDAALSILNC